MIKKFLACSSGSLAMALSLGMVPTILALSAAIDFGRAESVRTAAQAALDSAVLAFAAGDIDDPASVSAFVTSNSEKIDALLSDVVIAKDADGVTTGTLRASMATSFMAIAGYRSIEMDIKSEAKGVETKKLVEVSFETTSAKGVFDKEVYFVTRDAFGDVATRDLVLDYNWGGSAASVTYTPAIGSTYSMEVPEYHSWAIELVVYIDHSFKGRKMDAISHFSDGADAADWQQISGSCADGDGETQTWEDQGDKDFADFAFILKCETETMQTGEVKLVR